MKLTTSARNTLAVLAISGVASTASAAFLDFTVDEGSVPGAAANVIVADKFNGGYTEVLTINADFSLDFIGVVSWSGLFKNDGTTLVPSQLGAFSGYNAYSIFEGSGIFDPFASTFSITNSSFSFVIDPDQNTSFVFNGGGADGVTLGGVGEDYEVGSASTLTVGKGIPGLPGAFLAIWNDFTLTDPDGPLYFIDPKNFYMTVEASGDFDEDNFVPGTFQITGDVSAVFLPVPEPGTLALLGLALSGLGLVSRRRAA